MERPTRFRWRRSSRAIGVDPTPARAGSRQSGMTLVEVMVAGVIAAILVGGIFTTFSAIGTTTQEVTTLLQLGQESGYIDDYVSRWIARGCSVTTVPAPSSAQEYDTADTLIIYIYDTSGAQIKKFFLTSDTLFEDSARMVTPYRADFDTSMAFVVYCGGAYAGPVRFVDFTYRLHTRIGGRTYFHPLSKVAAACKNGTTY